MPAGVKTLERILEVWTWTAMSYPYLSFVSPITIIIIMEPSFSIEADKCGQSGSREQVVRTIQRCLPLRMLSMTRSVSKS